jgi:hypothetical protein
MRTPLEVDAQLQRLVRLEVRERQAARGGALGSHSHVVTVRHAPREGYKVLSPDVTPSPNRAKQCSRTAPRRFVT